MLLLVLGGVLRAAWALCAATTGTQNVVNECPATADNQVCTNLTCVSGYQPARYIRCCNSVWRLGFEGAVLTTSTACDATLYEYREVTTGLNCRETPGCDIIQGSHTKCITANRYLSPSCTTGGSSNGRSGNQSPAGCGRGGGFIFDNYNVDSTYGCQAGWGTTAIACLCICATGPNMCPPTTSSYQATTELPAAPIGANASLVCGTGYESPLFFCQNTVYRDVTGPRWVDANGNFPACRLRADYCLATAGSANPLTECAAGTLGGQCTVNCSAGYESARDIRCCSKNALQGQWRLGFEGADLTTSTACVAKTLHEYREVTNGLNCRETPGCDIIYQGSYTKCITANRYLSPSCSTGGSTNSRSGNLSPAGCGRAAGFLYTNANVDSTYGCQAGWGTSAIACLCICAKLPNMCPPAQDLPQATGSLPPAVRAMWRHASFAKIPRTTACGPRWVDSNGSLPACRLKPDYCPATTGTQLVATVAAPGALGSTSPSFSCLNNYAEAGLLCCASGAVGTWYNGYTGTALTASTGCTVQPSWQVYAKLSGAKCEAEVGCASIYDSEKCRVAIRRNYPSCSSSVSLNIRNDDNAPAGCSRSGAFSYLNSKTTSTQACLSYQPCLCNCSICLPLWGVPNAEAGAQCDTGRHDATCQLACEEGYEPTDSVRCNVLSANGPRWVTNTSSEAPACQPKSPSVSPAPSSTSPSTSSSPVLASASLSPVSGSPSTSLSSSTASSTPSPSSTTSSTSSPSSAASSTTTPTPSVSSSPVSMSTSPSKSSSIPAATSPSPSLPSCVASSCTACVAFSAGSYDSQSCQLNVTAVRCVWCPASSVCVPADTFAHTPAVELVTEGLLGQLNREYKDLCPDQSENLKQAVVLCEAEQALGVCTGSPSMGNAPVSPSGSTLYALLVLLAIACFLD
eukprot:g15197.t1